MKKFRAACLILAICMLLSLSCFASGEASGSSVTLIKVSDDNMTVNGDTTGAEVDGELPSAADEIAGIYFRAASSGDKFITVSAGEHVDALTDGFTAVIGSEEDVYEAPALTELYTNEGLNPNSEGFDLDYTWISQIDWDETSDTYGAYTPVTEEGQTMLADILDGGYSNVILGATSDDETVSRGPTQVSVSGGAALLVRNTFIYSEGLEGLAISNMGSSGVGSVMVVKDSLFVTRGYVPSSASTSENLPNDPLLVTGSDRTNLSGGESVTYYYDSAVIVDGWASLSTDSASGDGVDLVAANTFASALLGGYGTYADGNCRDYFYGSVLEGAEIGVIIAGTGEVSIFDGDEGLAGGAGSAVGLYGDIEPYAYADEDADYGELGGSVIAGGRYGVMMHVAGSAPVERQGYFCAKDSAIVTDAELYSDEDTEYSINASWYGRELSPNIQKYIELTQGADIFLRGCNGEIILDNVDMTSYSGTLIRSALNNDTSTPETPAGSGAVGTTVSMSNMNVAGDIIDSDYERVMKITLDNTTLTGDIVSGTEADWTEYWLDAGYAEDYTIGLASNTFGSEAALDAFVHTLAFNEDGTDYVYTPYGGDEGTELTLVGGSVWNVAGQSNLTALTVEEGCVVNGTVTVDGQTVDVTAGGSWTGDIVITASASAEIG